MDRGELAAEIVQAILNEHGDEISVETSDLIATVRASLEQELGT